MPIIDILKLKCPGCGGPVHGPNKICGGGGGNEKEETSEAGEASDSDQQNTSTLRGDQQDNRTAVIAAPVPIASESSTSLTFK